MSSPTIDYDAVENVVLVVSDSLRADTAADDMPTLQSLADDHGRCTDCFSLGPHTPPSMTGFVQSRQPIEGGYGTVLPASPPTIAEPLAAAGVQCGGWHCNPHTLIERDFHRGFDVYADLIRHGPLHAPGTEADEDDATATSSDATNVREVVKSVADRLHARGAVNAAAEVLKRWGLLSVDPRVPAEELLDAYEQWLPETDDGPRFAYLHFMDTHMPYKPPDSHWSHSELEPVSSRRAERLYQHLCDDEYSFSDAEMDDLYRLYRAEAEYVDRQLDRLVEHLRSTGEWESTLLIVTSDHGELFGERAAPDGTVTDHPSYLCEELTHVPLVLAGPPVSSFTDDSLVSGLDVAPTVATALGADVPESWQGQPLGDHDREFVVSSVASPWDGTVDEVDESYVHVSVRSSDLALLWWNRDQPAEWYERTDSGETAIEAPDPDTERAMMEAARAYRSVSFTDAADVAEGAIPEQRLEDLGYL